MRQALMAKDPAHMTHAERMSALMHDLSSPTAVAKADKILDLIGHEWLDVLSVRDMAARRHSDTSTPPAMPAPPGAESTRKHEANVGGMTVADLVDRYRSDTKSPYQELRFKTREHYDVLIKAILKDCGDRRIAELKTGDIENLHKGWSAGGKLSMGKSVVTMLRSLVYYGATAIEDRDCESLAIILHRLKFAVAQTRSENLTAEQAVLICEAAYKLDRPSIALAQAFQWDCNFRQKDVIGEWLPVSEPGDSDVFEDKEKWLRGLLWDEIDANFILTHITSKDQKRVVVDLKKQTPMVMKELQRQFHGFDGMTRSALPAKGPIIISEASELPWTAQEFRRWWRKAANKAGVPSTVKNMDSRVRTRVRGSDINRAKMLEADKAEIEDLLFIAHR